jgi:hypothetical protein
MRYGKSYCELLAVKPMSCLVKTTMKHTSLVIISVETTLKRLLSVSTHLKKQKVASDLGAVEIILCERDSILPFWFVLYFFSATEHFSEARPITTLEYYV